MPTLPPAQVGDASIPEDFPADVPIPEGAETYAVQQLAGDAKNVILKTEQERPELYSTYREQLVERGWKVEQEYDGRDQSFLSFRKGNTLTNVIIATEPSTGKQIVAIMYQEEKPLPFEEF